MTSLVKYDTACRAIADAAQVDEVKDIRDKSEAMRAYARQANNKDLEVQAAEIRIRAERRIGQLMAAQRDAGDMSKGGRPAKETGFEGNPVSKPPTLKEAGVGKAMADRARKMAAIPDDEFEGIVGGWREKVAQENERVTVTLEKAGEKHSQETGSEQNPVFEPLDDLGAENQALRSELEEAQSRIERLEAQIKDLTSDNAGQIIGRLQKQVEAAKYAKVEAEKKAARFKRQLAEAQKRIKQLESEEIEI